MEQNQATSMKMSGWFRVKKSFGGRHQSPSVSSLRTSKRQASMLFHAVAGARALEAGRKDVVKRTRPLESA